MTESLYRFGISDEVVPGAVARRLKEGIMPLPPGMLPGEEHIRMEIATHWATENLVLADLRPLGFVPLHLPYLGRYEDFSDARHVLVEHLMNGIHGRRILETLAYQLGQLDVGPSWDRVCDSYQSTQNAAEQDAAARLLEKWCTPDRAAQLVEFFADPSRGKSRKYFVRPVWEWGGEAGRALIRAL